MCTNPNAQPGLCLKYSWIKKSNSEKDCMSQRAQCLKLEDCVKAGLKEGKKHWFKLVSNVQLVYICRNE